MAGLDLTRNPAERSRWSPSAERAWIVWTAAVSILWSVWYLAVPTMRSLVNLADKIRHKL